jgi:uncharacterized protein YjbI with pentapeptide repeats
LVWNAVQNTVRYVCYLISAWTAASVDAGELLGPEGITLRADDIVLSTRDVVTTVFQAPLGTFPDFSRRTLRNLDLSGLDFKRARLAGADMFGVDLTGANLQQADLSGANLNRTTVIRADFSGAQLTGATLMRPSVSSTLDYDVLEAPKFVGANMRNIRMTSKMIGADFRKADLSGARMGPHEPRADLSSIPASILKSCDFSNAILVDADLSRAILTFSLFVGANLRGADLSLADLSKADMSNADLTGADLTDANLDETNIRGVTGLETVRGRNTIRNLERALR